MISKEDLEKLFTSVESFRVERMISTTNMDKLSEAICAFANDLPYYRFCSKSNPINAAAPTSVPTSGGLVPTTDFSS